MGGSEKTKVGSPLPIYDVSTPGFAKRSRSRSPEQKTSGSSPNTKRDKKELNDLQPSIEASQLVDTSSDTDLDNSSPHVETYASLYMKDYNSSDLEHEFANANANDGGLMFDKAKLAYDQYVSSESDDSIKLSSDEESSAEESNTRPAELVAQELEKLFKAEERAKSYGYGVPPNYTKIRSMEEYTLTISHNQNVVCHFYDITNTREFQDIQYRLLTLAVLRPEIHLLGVRTGRVQGLAGKLEVENFPTAVLLKNGQVMSYLPPDILYATCNCGVDAMTNILEKHGMIETDKEDGGNKDAP